MYCKVWHVCRWVLSRGSYNGVSAYPVRPTFPGASSNKNTTTNTTWSTNTFTNTNTWQWGVFYPMSTAFLEAKYKYLLLTEVAGLARLQWIRTIQDFSNLYRFQMLNSRSYESWFVWRMANRSDEQVWISVTLQHLNKLWWTGNTLTSKLKNTGPLVIDFVLVKAFKTRKYIENSRMTKQYERQWRAPVKPGESKRYSTHQNIHEENKKSVLFFLCIN